MLAARRAVLALALAAPVLGAAALASAQSVEEMIPFKAKTTGEVPEGGSTAFGVLIPEGTTKVTVQAKIAKGSTLVPRLSLVAPDGTVTDEDDFAAAGAKVKASSKAVTVKNLPVGTTGLYKLVVSGDEGTGGGFAFKFKAKAAKGFKGAGSLVSAQDFDDYELAAPENAFLTLKIKPSKQTPFGPDLEILTPSGEEVPWDDFSKIGKDDSITIKNLPLPFFGDYTLRVGSRAGFGDYAIAAKVKAAKAPSAPSGAPVADAGDDVVVTPGYEGSLDGSGTTGADEWWWEQVSGPTVELDDPRAAMPTFTAPEDRGTHVFQLVGSNDFGFSVPDLVVVETDTVPVAGTGPAQAAASGNPVTLNGSASFDLDDGDTLVYRWTQVSGPSATLDDPTSPTPTFTPSTAGVYVFELVVSDGTADSAPERVVVVVDGAGPAPDAGLPQIVGFQDSVFVSGAASLAASGGSPATWTWTRVDTDPAEISLVGTDEPVLAFTAPRSAATLRFRLSVDGNGTFDEVTVLVAPGRTNNLSPIASAGGVRNVASGASTTLDGSGSQDDGAISTFTWMQLAGPTAPPDDTTVSAPSVTAPTNGVAQYLLMVHDGDKYGAPDVVTLVGGTADRPVANAGGDRSGGTGAGIFMDGSMSTGATTWTWTQWSGHDVYDASQDGAFSASSSIPSFNVPTDTASLTPNRDLLFRLVVNGPSGTSHADWVRVRFTNLPRNAQPSVSASASITMGRPGDGVTLTADASDGDGDDLTYSWSQVSGPPVSIGGSTMSEAGLTLPVATGDLVFRILVSDGTGEFNQTATDEVTVTVNQAPQIVLEADPMSGGQGTNVTLDGSGTTDADDQSLTFLWEEIPPPVGNPVSLSGTDTDTATFTMPSYTGTVNQRTRTFRLTVTDSFGPSFAVSQTVQFIPNTAPTVSGLGAAGDRKFRYDNSDSETLTVSTTTDADGDPLTFSWRIVSGPSTSSSLLSSTSGSSISIRVPKPTSQSPNRGGVYTLGVVASDGAELSAESTIQVLAMPSFANDVAPIFNSCNSSSCHGAAKNPILSGSSASIYSNLQSYIVANNASSSSLYSQVNSGNMPKNSPKLSADLIAMIADWIEPERSAQTKPGISNGNENN